VVLEDPLGFLVRGQDCLPRGRTYEHDLAIPAVSEGTLTFLNGLLEARNCAIGHILIFIELDESIFGFSFQLAVYDYGRFIHCFVAEIFTRNIDSLLWLGILCRQLLLDHCLLEVLLELDHFLRRKRGSLLGIFLVSEKFLKIFLVLFRVESQCPRRSEHSGREADSNAILCCHDCCEIVDDPTKLVLSISLYRNVFPQTFLNERVKTPNPTCPTQSLLNQSSSS
jgi:hypothetical protein